MKRFAVLALLFLSPAARGDFAPERPDCARSSAGQFFFPAGVLGERTKRFDADQFPRTWYSKHLRAMSEPSLSCSTTAVEAYRFLWLRTWGAPIAVRLERNADVAALSAVTLDGAGGYDPGVVTERVQRKLSAEEWKTIAAGLNKTEFWKMEGHVDGDGLDGAQWILEGRRGTQYHVVDRWSPKTGAYREFCLSLLRLAAVLPTGTSKRDAIY